MQTFKRCNLHVKDNIVADYLKGVNGNYIVLENSSR